MLSVTATKLEDLLRHKSAGEPVNAHVVKAIPEPQPDFGAMKRIIESGEAPRQAHEREPAP